jgi:hypothetical protein
MESAEKGHLRQRRDMGNSLDSKHRAPDHVWLRTRRELLTRLKSEVQRRLGPEPRDVRVYGVRYAKEFRKRWQISSKAELMAAIEGADLVYGGDFHALGQSQRTHLKILRVLSGERPVVLALECFGISAQKWLDAYLAGKIDLDELRQKARWGKTWGFPWENYRPLLELARRKGFRLLALNDLSSSSGASLVAREKTAAARIREAYFRHPGALIYVVFGDLHLAQSHLPARVREAMGRSRRLREVVVHLNSERIYFQLARKGLELTTDVVRLGLGHYCVLASPPWVQWQSYLMYLERTEDVDLGFGEEDADDDEEKDFDPTDQVATLARLVAADLGLKSGVDLRFDDFAIYSVDDSHVWQAFEQKLAREERGLARQLLASGRTFYLPSAGAGFLGQHTVNHAAALAGQYVHAKLCGMNRPIWRMPGDFTALIWVEAVSYFLSKLVNHKRQAETLADLRSQLAMANPSDQGREAMKLALDQSMSELIWLQQGRRRKLHFKPRRRSSYLEAARILGGMLGERLYLVYRSRRIDRRRIIKLLRCDVLSSGFQKEYEDLLRVVSGAIAKGRGTELKVKSRRERL